VAINSKVSHTEQRQLARQTWVASVTKSAREAGFSARAQFVLSGAGSAVELREEEGHNDILALPVPEGYFFLAQKTTALLRWFDESTGDVLIEVDDDVFVHLQPLWAKLHELGIRRDGPPVYAGYVQKMPTPQNRETTSKWFVPDAARAAIPAGRYVTGQLKVLSRTAVHMAVASMGHVGMQPHGVSDPATQVAVEDEYLGVLLHHAGVHPTAIQLAVAPQCCHSSDVFIVLDGDEYFVKTHNGQHAWDEGAGTADTLCRYRVAASHFEAARGRPFCLSADELSLTHCPPHNATVRPDTAAMLRTLC
jgi:hypothetical protein